MQNETIDKLKNAGYITVTDDSQGIADKVGISGGGRAGEPVDCVLFGDDASSIVNAIVERAIEIVSERTSDQGIVQQTCVYTLYNDYASTYINIASRFYKNDQLTIYSNVFNNSTFPIFSNTLKCTVFYWKNAGEQYANSQTDFQFDITDYSSLYEILYKDMIQPSGTLEITKNGTGIDVFEYANVNVAVPQPQPSGTINIDTNGTYNVAQYAKAKVNVEGGGGSAEYPEAIVECTDGFLPVMDYNLNDDFTDPENPVFSLEGFISLKDGNDVVSVDFDDIETELQSIRGEWDNSGWPESIIDLSTNPTNLNATVYDIPESSTVLAPLVNFSLFDIDDVNFLTRFPLIKFNLTYTEEGESGQLESGAECNYHMTSSIMDHATADGRVEYMNKIFEYCSTGGEIITNLGWIIPVTRDDITSLSRQNNPTLPEKLYLILLCDYNGPQPAGTFKICNVWAGVQLDDGGTLH